MVYLLQKYFGKDGREEADEMLIRSSGSEEAPRMLGAFNEETPDWLRSLCSHISPTETVKCSRSHWHNQDLIHCRTCRFMLTEEAHQNGVGRIIQRTCEAMNCISQIPMRSDAYDLGTTYRLSRKS